MNIRNKQQWKNIFLNACEKGHLDDVQCLCEKQYLDCGWGDIHCYDDYGFNMACENGHLDIVKYLLTSHELKEAGHTFADLHVMNEQGFRGACENGHLNIIKYLLTSTDLKAAGHALADAHAKKDYGFHLACANEHWNVVRWLVFDYGIEKTPSIQKIIKKYPQAQEYFRAREDLKEIQRVLKNNDPDKMTDPPSERTDNRSVKKPKKL